MKHKLIVAATVVGVGALAFAMGIFFGSSKSGSTESPAQESHSAEATIWTCSMHPQIRQDKPGKCPICGMDLIPLKTGSHEEGQRKLEMSQSAMALAEVRTSSVIRQHPTVEIPLVGTLSYDETRVRSLTARFPARIEELFVNYTGIPVQEGEHLAIIYSPELLTAQNELLVSQRSDPQGIVAKAAREKLRLWDLLPDQIDSILERGEVSDRFELRAPVGGIVVKKNVSEGDYVQTGQTLFTIVDLSQLWLKLDAFESDLQWLRYGQSVSFTVESYPGESFEGTIAFIEPEFDRQTRTVSVRVNVPNDSGRLKPGMFARGTVKMQIADSGQVYAPDLSGKWISPMHPEIIKDHPGVCDICGMDLVPAESLGYVTKPGEMPLLVPSSAVLQTGKRAVVYVQLPDTEQPTFEGREIVLGRRAGDVYEVESGLNEGDRVVTNGAFKIDSALQIQAKPSMMNPPAEPAGHEHHHEMKMPRNDSAALHLEAAQAADLLPDYLAVHQALAGDDLDAAHSALKAMMQKTGHQGAIPAFIHTMLATEDLEAIRRPHFETLSNLFIEAVKSEPEAFSGAIYRMHCPMVYPDRGADWLQTGKDVSNPYFGAVMLTCGELTETLAESR